MNRLDKTAGKEIWESGPIWSGLGLPPSEHVLRGEECGSVDGHAGKADHRPHSAGPKILGCRGKIRRGLSGP